MHVTFYKTGLCPRCHMVRKSLEALRADYPELVIDTVDIFLAPGRARRDGIRMIPALKADHRMLSGIYLTREKIVNFLDSLQPTNAGSPRQDRP